VTDTGGILITMHFSGDADKAWPHCFEWVKPRVYQFQQWGSRCNRSVLQATAEMVTEMPAQLANTTTELEVRFQDWTPV
jgi:heme A synthase